MRKRILSLCIIFSFLVFSPSLRASEIRMMGLANPWLVIPDSDTDWKYNPAYLADASNQVYTQYIFGWGDFYNSWSDLYGTTNWHSTEGRGDARTHIGKLGYINNLCKGKMAFTTGYSSMAYDLPGITYTRDAVWSSRTHFPKELDRDTNITAAYVYPVNQNFSLGVSGSWDRIDKNRKIFNVSDGNQDTTSAVYNRWDVTLALSWRLKPEIQLGLSAGAGQLPGEYDFEKNNVATTLANVTRGRGGDYDGTQTHILGNLNYQLNERLRLSTIVFGQWQKETYGTALDLAGSPKDGNKNRDKTWDAIFGIGGLYTINKDSGFLVGGGIYYTYEDWRHKYNENLGATLNLNSDRESSNTVELRLGTEKKLLGKLVGRGGVYYSFGFIDKYELYRTGALAYELNGGGFARKFGLGLGLSYNLTKSSRLDLGFDIPIIADRVTKVTGDLITTSGSSHRDSDKRNYIVGLNFAYLF